MGSGAKANLIYVRKAIASGIVIAVILTLFPGQLSAQSFANCAAVKAKYRDGVARDFNVVFTAAFHVSRQIYRANKRLDVDRDGVICETEALATTTDENHWRIETQLDQPSKTADDNREHGVKSS